MKFLLRLVLVLIKKAIGRLKFLQKIYFEMLKKIRFIFLKKNKNKKLFDLRGYVTHKLLKLNINVDHINLDTFKQKSNF